VDTVLATKNEKDEKEKIIEENKGLVISIAINFLKTYNIEFIDFEDLIQEGIIGLLIAVDKFKPEKGYKLSTYAVPYIKRNIMRYVQKNSKSVNVSAHAYRKITKLNITQKSIEQSNKVVSLDEISEITGFSVSEVAFLMKLREPVISLNQDVKDEYGSELSELIDIIIDKESEENIYRKYFEEELKKSLEESLKILTKKERMVLEMRYGLNGFNGRTLKLKEIAEIFGVSFQRITNIENNALKKLRNSYKTRKLLMDFL